MADLVKIDILNYDIIAYTEDVDDPVVTPISSLTGADLTLYNQYMVIINAKWASYGTGEDYKFVSLNITEPVSRVCFLFKKPFGRFEEWLFSAMDQDDQDLFDEFVAMVKTLE